MHTREMANMQRQLQQTNAALRVMQQQRRQGTAERVQRLRASPAAVAGSFSHLWEMDAIEKKIRAQEQQQQRRAAPRESVPDGSRCEASAVSEPSGVRPPTRPTERPTERPMDFLHTHRLEAELRSLTDKNSRLQADLHASIVSKAGIEAEAVDYQQRMDAAVASLEGIVEQAAQEKHGLFQEMLALKQQMATTWANNGGAPPAPGAGDTKLAASPSGSGEAKRDESKL